MSGPEHRRLYQWQLAVHVVRDGYLSPSSVADLTGPLPLQPFIGSERMTKLEQCAEKYV